MATARSQFRFQAKLTASSLVAAACSLSAPLLLNPARVCAQVTTTPPSVAGANPLDMPTIDSTAVVFDLRDVPVRQGLELLLMASHNPFSVDNKVSGFITMKAVNKPLRAALDVFCSSCSTPLEYRYENAVLFIGPKPSDAQNAPPVFPTAASPSPTPKSASDVPRRVAGVLILKSGPAYAILEVGTPFGSNTRVMVVEFRPQGDPTHVPSGIAGVADLTVTGIDVTGLTLRADDGTTIHVPLAGVVSH